MIRWLPDSSDIMKDENSYRDGQITARALQNLTNHNLEEQKENAPVDPSVESSQEESCQFLQFVDPCLFLWDVSTQLDSHQDHPDNPESPPQDSLNPPANNQTETPPKSSVSPEQLQEEPLSHNEISSISEESQDQSEFGIPAKPQTQPEKKKGRGKANPKLRKDYGKNIVCNIIKCVAELIFGNWQKVSQRICQENGVNYSDLKDIFQKKLLSVSGPNKLHEMLASGNACSPILCSTLKTLIQVVLRRGYLPQMVRDGRMAHKEEYIRFKNEYLLYFPTIEQ